MISEYLVTEAQAKSVIYSMKTALVLAKTKQMKVTILKFPMFLKENIDKCIFKYIKRNSNIGFDFSNNEFGLTGYSQFDCLITISEGNASETNVRVNSDSDKSYTVCFTPPLAADFAEHLFKDLYPWLENLLKNK